MRALPYVAALWLAARPAAALAGGSALDAGEALEVPAEEPGMEHGKPGTADASPVDPGVLELEGSFLPVWEGTARRAASRSMTFAASVAYGVAPDVAVKLGAGFASLQQDGAADGVGAASGAGGTDAVTGARWRFLRAGSLEIAVLGEVVIPVGARGSGTDLALSQGFWSGRVGLAATKDLGPLTANLEVACSAPLGGDTAGAGAIVQTNAAVGYGVTHVLQPEVELHYTAALGADPSALAAMGGVIVLVGDRHRVMAAVERSLWAPGAPPWTSAVLALKTSL